MNIAEQRRKAFLTQQAEFDAAKKEESQQESPMEVFKDFNNLITIVNFIINSKDLEIKTIDDLVDELTLDLNEEEADKMEFMLEKLLTYIKVPSSSITDLINEDKEIGSDEYGILVDLLAERIGDNDVVEFIVYALHNEALPDDEDADADSIYADMDWAFFPSEGACKLGDGMREVPMNKAVQTCTKGFSHGRKGFWRYPKGKFPQGSYKLKGGGSRKTGTTIPNLVGSKPHSPKATKFRAKSMEKRSKAGMSVFGGFLKSRKTKQGKKSSNTAEA